MDIVVLADERVIAALDGFEVSFDSYYNNNYLGGCLKMKEAHQSKSGFSLKIFMPHGEPDGIKIIEKSNWTGQGIVFPRALFHKARTRDELNRTGVYII